jgi:hypothetical protein
MHRGEILARRVSHLLHRILTGFFAAVNRRKFLLAGILRRCRQNDTHAGQFCVAKPWMPALYWDYFSGENEFIDAVLDLLFVS